MIIFRNHTPFCIQTNHIRRLLARDFFWHVMFQVFTIGSYMYMGRTHFLLLYYWHTADTMNMLIAKLNNWRSYKNIERFTTRKCTCLPNTYFIFFLYFQTMQTQPEKNSKKNPHLFYLIKKQRIQMICLGVCWMFSFHYDTCTYNL